MKSKLIEFITLAEVNEIHQDQISLYCGNIGIRDINLLSSALAIPQATFDGEYLYKDLFEMAGEYNGENLALFLKRDVFYRPVVSHDMVKKNLIVGVPPRPSPQLYSQ